MLEGIVDITKRQLIVLVLIYSYLEFFARQLVYYEVQIDLYNETNYIGLYTTHMTIQKKNHIFIPLHKLKYVFICQQHTSFYLHCLIRKKEIEKNVFANHMNRLSLSNDNGKYFANSELLKFLEHTKFSNLHDHKTLLIRLSVDGSKNVLEII